MKKFAVVFVAAFTLSGCAYLTEFLKAAQGSGLFNQPNFKFRTANLADVSLGGLTLDTVWELENPNDIGISLASIDYALFIEGKQVVAGSPQKGLQIPARGTTLLHFPASFKFTDVAQVVDVFLNKDTAKWRAEGSLGIDTPIGVVKLPISREEPFEVPKVPQVVFGNPRVTSITLSGATVEFPMTVTNRNTYALPIGGVSGNLAIAGSNVGTITTGNLGDMQGKGAHQAALPITINFLSAAGAVVNAVRGGNAPVTFNAQVQSGGQSVPLKVDQLLTFVR